MAKLRIRGEDWVMSLARSIRYKGESCFGLCSKVSRHIILEESMPAKQLMRIALHEGLHACNWDHDETSIKRDATILTMILWKLGFRLTKPTHSHKGKR